MATQKDVADLAGVSFITVSRVVNKKGNVREETRSRVEEAIKSLNYYPNSLGQALNKGSTDTIGVLAPLPRTTSMEGNMFFSGLLEGIERASSERGYDLLLSTQRLGEGFDYLKLYRQRKVDGMVFIGSNDMAAEELAMIERERIPCVVLNDRPQSASLSYVDTDNYEGAAACVRRIAALGHRRIAFLGVDSYSANIRDRERGARAALRELGLEAREEWFLKGDYSEGSGARAATALLGMGGGATALFCATDVMAMGAIRGALAAGFSVPGDLSVVGFDGLPVTRYTRPMIESCAQPLLAMGRAAAEMLFARIKEPGLPKEARVFPVERSPGESLGPI